MKHFIFALLLFPLLVFADVMPGTVSGNVVTYAASTMSAADLANAAISRASDSSIQVQKTIDLVVGGKAATVTGISKPLPINYSKAVGNFLRGAGGAALKTAGAVYAVAEVAKSLWDLCNELGFSCSKGSDGKPIVTKPNPDACTAGPCYYWTYSGASYSTQQLACKAYENFRNTNYPNIVTIASAPTNGSYDACYVYEANKSTGQLSLNGNYSVGVSRGASRSPDTDSGVSASIEELESSVAAKSGWPSSSSLPKVLEQAVTSGERLELPAPTVTGPSTVQGPQTTQNTPSQNGQPSQTKTTNTVYNITYEGNKVTTNNVTTTVINNGSTTTTTTETKEEQPEAAPSDSVNPDLPTLYKRKYPDGLAGVWTTRKAELSASPLLSLLQNMMPTISGSGGCPQFSIPAQIGPLVFGTGALGPPCAVWDFCKIVILLTAAFLARAIVFGG